MIVYNAILQPGDRALAMDTSAGGHISHGHPLSFLAKYFNVKTYGVDKDGYLDYDEIEKIAKEFKPKLNEQYYTNQDYPIYAAEWIKENLDYKNIKLFNEYNYGSYLIYEGIPVMIDSRCDLYTPQYNTKTGNPADGQDIFMDVQNVATGDAKYNEVFDQYGITHVITYSDSSLNKKLKSDSDYKKIYPTTLEQKMQDDRFVIYEKIEKDESVEE